MKVVVQRCRNASVSVSKKQVSSIEEGLLLLVGFTEGDNEEMISKMVRKVVNLRIFPDENGIMNKSILDTNGSILSISQFTLYADTKKGNRPSYIHALGGESAKILYDIWNQKLKREVVVETGIFGADMDVSFINMGPTTIILEI